MSTTDFTKAFGLGLGALVLNLLTLVVAVFIYAQFINPGHAPEFYNEMAPKIGSWTAPIVGPLLIFLFVWAFSRRRPERNPYLFGTFVFLSYFVADTALGIAVSSARDLLRPPFILGMITSAIAAFFAAFLAEKGSTTA